MAAATLVGTTNATAIYFNYNGSGLIPLPTGTAAGDLLVWVASIQLVNTSGNIVITPPTGATGFASWGSTSGYPRQVQAYYKKITAADISAGGLATSWNNTNGANSEVIISAWRGNNINVDASNGYLNAATLPSYTTAKAGETVLGFVSVDSQTSGSNTIAVPSGYSRVIDFSNNTPQVNILLRTAVTGTAGTQVGESNGTGYSTYGAILTLTVNTAPNAPTWAASPAEGATLDRTQAQTVSWTHSDPDGDAQTAWDLRYRPAGSTGAWTTISGTGSTPTASLPANSVAGKLELNVRTYDTSSAQGAWSVLRHLNFLDPAIGTASTAPTRLDPLAVLAMHTALQANDAAVLAQSLAAGVSLGSLGIVQAQKAQGTYTGDGTASRTIAVGFAPDLVILNNVSGGPLSATLTRTTAVTSGYAGSSGTIGAVSNACLTATGFTNGSDGSYAGGNANGYMYAWTAFKFV